MTGVQDQISPQDVIAQLEKLTLKSPSADIARLSTHARRCIEANLKTISEKSVNRICVLIFELESLTEALACVELALSRQKKNVTLLNLKGVILRRTGRGDEAAVCFRLASKLDPANLAPLINAGNVYLDLRQSPQAVEVFSRLVKLAPRTGEFQGQLGFAYYIGGEYEKAVPWFEESIRLAPQDPYAPVGLAQVLEECRSLEAALEVLDAAIARIGPSRILVTGRIAALRRKGQVVDAERYLADLLTGNPNDAWLHYQFARTLLTVDRPRANAALSRALTLAPDDPDILLEYAESLDRTRGPEEGANIAKAYELAMRRLALGGDLRPAARALRNILIRSTNYEAMERLGGFETLGLYWARADQEAALHYMMSQADTPERRRQLVSFHRLWGEGVDRRAAGSPLTRAPAVTGRAKIRIGLMSSDLRDHPVAYFAAPLVQLYDRSRFEIYCYSWNTGAPDAVQQKFAQWADAFRLAPLTSDRDAAQLIAEDQLDVLMELGGSTDMNKLRTMAWRPAPRQGSWLGYPHSSGLASIDRILTDPFITPADPALLVEKPLQLAHSWVAFQQPGFGPLAPIEPATPQQRNGFVTFGTMNNPYKYNLACLNAWAEIMSRVPGSKFLFVRPEGAAASFRDNLVKHFAPFGIAPERLLFAPVRGQHLRFYNMIDVALDTFPQTGGTTTCETLWMGVPLVTLAGEAFFERLSHSNLNNAGLGAWSVSDVTAYKALAVALAADTDGRVAFRRNARQQIGAHPLGRPDLFVQDFQSAVEAWMDEQPA